MLIKITKEINLPDGFILAAAEKRIANFGEYYYDSIKKTVIRACEPPNYPVYICGKVPQGWDYSLTSTRLLPNQKGILDVLKSTHLKSAYLHSETQEFTIVSGKNVRDDQNVFYYVVTPKAKSTVNKIVWTPLTKANLLTVSPTAQRFLYAEYDHETKTIQALLSTTFENLNRWIDGVAYQAYFSPIENEFPEV